MSKNFWKSLLVSPVSLGVALAVSSAANAANFNPSIILGTNDRNNQVVQFRIPNSPTPPFISTYINRPGNNLGQTNISRPRGIAFDEVNKRMFIGLSRPETNNRIVINNVLGTNPSYNFRARANISGTTTDLRNLNGLTYRNGFLYGTNSFVYGGSDPQRVDRNIYRWDVSNLNTNPNPIGQVFGTLDSGVFSGNVFLNGLKFGPDGNLYVIQQQGGSGGGQGFLRRFNGTTGAYLDTIDLNSSSSFSQAGLFGLTFGPNNDIYFGRQDDVLRLNYLGLGANGRANYNTGVAVVSNLNTSMLCDVLFARDGFLYAASLDRLSMFKINPTTGVVVATADSSSVSFEPKTDFLIEIEKEIVKLFEVEGRAGVKGIGDYEFAIGLNGASADNTGNFNLLWQDGVNLNWSLAWAKSTGTATFTIGSQSITYGNIGAAGLDFNLFELKATAITDAGIVDPNTTISFAINNINSSALATPYSISATSPAINGRAFQEYASGIFNTNPIATMGGTININWPSALDPTRRGRSRLAIKLKGFDPPASTSSNTPQSVPEPGLGIGMLAVVLFQLASRYRCSQ